jgi:hypothetical protein
LSNIFLQKKMPGWEQRKRTVSDTTKPVIRFNRANASPETTRNSKPQVEFQELIELEKRIDALESMNEEEALKKLNQFTVSEATRRKWKN